MLNVNQITSTLAKLPDAQLQQYAALHKSDPYIMALAVSESNRRKAMRAGAQGAQGEGAPPKVADQAVAGMAAPMPEDRGIARLPAGDMNFAGGGIVAFAGGGESQIPAGVQASRDQEAYQIVLSEFQRAMAQLQAAQASGNPAGVSRAQADVVALQRELGRFTKKGIGQAVAEALPMSTAQAAPVAPVAPAAQPETGYGQQTAARLTGGAGLAGLGTWLAKTFGSEALNAQFRPGTTAAQAASRIGVGAAAVPATVLAGGAAATKQAANTVAGMSPEQRSDFYSNPMLGAMGGDTGLAAAIMNAGEGAIAPAEKPMPYGQQMANVAKFFVGHPDVRRPAPPKAPPTGVGPGDPGWGKDLGFEPPPTLAPQQEKAVVDAVKESTPAKARKGFDNEDLLMLGLNLMANKSPRFLQALGESGIAAVKNKKERIKEEREAEADLIKSDYSKALAEQARAIAGSYNSDDKLVAQAMKTAAANFAAWMRSPMNTMASPAEQDAQRQKFMQEALAAARISGVPAAGADTGGFRLLGPRAN